MSVPSGTTSMGMSGTIVSGRLSDSPEGSRASAAGRTMKYRMRGAMVSIDGASITMRMRNLRHESSRTHTKNGDEG